MGYARISNKNKSINQSIDIGVLLTLEQVPTAGACVPTSASLYLVLDRLIS